jgi:hypothetical protein
MTILAPHDASRIRNRSMGVLHLIAADESCEVSDILALLSQPSPASQAPAARTYPPVPVDVQAEEERHASSVTPSPEPQPTSTPAVQSAVDADLDEQERAIETGKPGEAEASPVTVKRKRAKREGKSIKQQVADAHGEHPDWSAEQIAEHTGAKLGSVRHALHDARTAAGTAEVEVIPPANPQTPVAPPPPPIGGTLKDRVRVRHQQHPTWTAALIAKDLGANQSSVSVYLAAIRREEAGEASEAAPAPAPPNTLPNQPAGSIEARLKADAAARRARLGAKP